MNRLIFLLIALIFFARVGFSQDILCDRGSVVDAYRLAVGTVDINTRRGVLAAGADYGGDWTRDIAINSWNAVSVLRPGVAAASLWNVTVKKDTIGDQYWDKIIWTVAALNHYRATGDRGFLAAAYRCASATMRVLEGRQLDRDYGLFMGPSVFNDGIAGYPSPIYDPANTHSGVMENAHTLTIKCLSTNCVYYGAYRALADMGRLLGVSGDTVAGFLARASALRGAILRHFYVAGENRLNYLIDQRGGVDASQEGLGLAFAVIFGVVDSAQAYRIIHGAHASSFGVTSIYPDFARYTADHPGRHNNLIWPMVNGFFAQAAVVAGDRVAFMREFDGLTRLALDADKGDYDFREIYSPVNGAPDGGWQANGPEHPDFHWASCKLQTWSATAYLNMVYYGLLGMRLEDSRLVFMPYLPAGMSVLTVKGIRYRGAVLDVTVRGTGGRIRRVVVNGKERRGGEVVVDGMKVTGRNEILVEVE